MVIKSYEEVYNYFLKNNVLLLSKEYKRSSEQLELLCLNCGKIFKKSLNKFQSGQTCSDCKKEKKRMEMYLYIKEYLSRYGYILISKKYIDAHNKLTIMCPQGHIVHMNWNNFKSGKRCRTCLDLSKRLEYDYVKKYVEDRKCKLISKEYSTIRDLLEFECENGHRFITTFAHFCQGNRCGVCKTSKGEKRILEYLLENNMKFIHDLPCFKDLIGVNKGLLRPDFIIEDKKIWIEFDGQQHFKPRDFQGKGKEEALKNLNILKQNDEIKNKYAEQHGYIMIRIPYWDYNNIENILSQFIK